jgi:hypothetical protein
MGSRRMGAWTVPFRVGQTGAAELDEAREPLRLLDEEEDDERAEQQLLEVLQVSGIDDPGEEAGGAEPNLTGPFGEMMANVPPRPPRPPRRVSRLSTI